MKPPTLAQIAGVFARHANVTFGGGSATIAVLHQQIVVRRAWLTQVHFDLAYALSRLTPGTNLLAFCTAAGWTMRRWPGAVVALIAASVPCSIVAVVATEFYETWHTNPAVASALHGALAAAVAIMIATAWTFAQPHVNAATAKAAVVIPAAALLSLRFSVSPMFILLGAAALGLLWPAATEKRG